MQNLSAKDIAGSDIMKLKVSQHHMKSLGRKGLMRSLLSSAFKFMHGKQKPVTLLLVKLMHLDTQWNLYLVD